MRSTKLTCERFTLNRKAAYLNLSSGKQIIIKPVQSEHAIYRGTWLLQTRFLETANVSHGNVLLY